MVEPCTISAVLVSRTGSCTVQQCRLLVGPEVGCGGASVGIWTVRCAAHHGAERKAAWEPGEAWERGHPGSPSAKAEGSEDRRRLLVLVALASKPGQLTPPTFPRSQALPSSQPHDVVQIGRSRSHGRGSFGRWSGGVLFGGALQPLEPCLCAFCSRVSERSRGLGLEGAELVRCSLDPAAVMVHAAMESRNGMVPEFLYSAKAATRSGASRSSFFRDVTSEFGGSKSAFTATSLFKQVAGAARTPAGVAPSFMVPAPSEGKIVMFSAEYYRACAVGGMLCCGLTHMGVTPIDVVKCNMQIAPTKYKSISSGFSLLVKEQGALGLFRGWVPTLLGYSVQGACKYGFYEYFKKTYSDMAGPENAKTYKTLIYLAGSASAEVIADVGLCPFEAVKVRVQTNPGFAKGLMDGMPKLIASDGFGGLYKGLVPLWGRQIPYTMMKFATFESTVEAIYKYAVPVPKSELSSSSQLGISFTAGYIAGVACAIISHPADNLVSFLNNAKGATVGQAIEQMGLTALFTRGLPLRIIMVGTLTGAQWGIYDAFKVFVGLPTTGGVVEEPKK